MGMLLLTRKLNESVYIGDGDQRTKVKVIEIGQNRVKLGFEGPRGVNVYREEILQQERSD